MIGLLIFDISGKYQQRKVLYGVKSSTMEEYANVGLLKANTPFVQKYSKITTLKIGNDIFLCYTLYYINLIYFFNAGGFLTDYGPYFVYGWGSQGWSKNNVLKSPMTESEVDVMSSENCNLTDAR